MIIFWIFALIFGVSAFSYGSALMGWGWFASLLFAGAGVLALRGMLSWVRRVLVLREQLPDEADADVRTLETNRYIFWRRLVFLALFPGAEIVIAYFVLLSSGQAPMQAVLTIGQFLGQMLLLALQLGTLLVIQFLIFFGPFIGFTLFGRQTLLPGDANYGVKIEDVRGQKAAVDEMRKILKLMERGRNYVRAGGQRERGVLMVGPPGTGKTMLAKAIATSMQTPIIISSGAGLQGIFIGMDAVAVFLMIRAAKKKAKRWGGCTVFIDEFDALGQRRGGMGGGGGVGGVGGFFGGFQLGLNMLLVLMDGIDNPGLVKRMLRRFVNITLDGLFIPPRIKLGGNAVSLRIKNIRPPRYNIFFMGATNRPSVLDEAVTRPGRFGRQINFELPRKEARKDIADLYFAKKAHDPELDSPTRREEFARITEFFSPAEIEQVLSLALMYAFEDGRSRFGWKDLREALVNVRMGLAKPGDERTEYDILETARHEMGHAVAARFYMPSYSSLTLSTRSRGGSLGHHSSLPRHEQFTLFRSQMAGRIRWTLGSLACERVIYGENTSGVTGDLQSAASNACVMIGVCGMGPDPLPADQSRQAADVGETLISRVEVTQGIQEQGTVVGTVLSNPLARRMVAQVLGSAYIDCWRLMFVNREAIDRGAEVLAAQREMVGDEVEAMLDGLGLRMFDEKDPYPEEITLVPPSRWEDVASNGKSAAAVGARPA